MISIKSILNWSQSILLAVPGFISIGSLFLFFSTEEDVDLTIVIGIVVGFGSLIWLSYTLLASFWFFERFSKVQLSRPERNQLGEILRGTDEIRELTSTRQKMSALLKLSTSIELGRLFVVPMLHRGNIAHWTVFASVIDAHSGQDGILFLLVGEGSLKPRKIRYHLFHDQELIIRRKKFFFFPQIIFQVKPFGFWSLRETSKLVEYLYQFHSNVNLASKSQVNR